MPKQTKQDAFTRQSMTAAIHELDAQCACRGLTPFDDEQSLLLLQALDMGEGRLFDEAHDMLDDLEARCGLNVDSARAALGVRHMSVVGFAWYNMGGGNSALRKLLTSGAYILVTDADDECSIPSGSANRVAIGLYGANGDPIVDAVIVETSGIETHVKTLVAIARNFLKQPAEICNDFQKLTAEWAVFCKQEGLPHISACDLRHRNSLTLAQTAYISKFIERWDGIS